MTAHRTHVARCGRSTIRVVLLAFGPLLLAGCSDSGLERYRVTGRITFEGRSVPAGEISFEPDRSRGGSGPGSVAPIRDGGYELPRERGTIGGPYRVRIIHLPEEDETKGTAEPAWFEPYETSIDLPMEDIERDFEIVGNRDGRRLS